MTTFSDLGLAEPFLRAVEAEGYTDPTPIQSKVIPEILNGRDVLGIAQTGTGKTASFVLPLLHAIAGDKRRADKKSCRALILVPTRELAAQVADSVRTYGRFARVTSTVIVGGVKPGPQIRALSNGVDIVIATPGRLEDHLSGRAIRLDATEAVVLDEADQMLDLGFMPAVRRILGKLPRERQTVLLSATMPKQIRGLASDFLNRPAEISVAPTARPIERIDQSVMHMAKAAKRGALVDLLAGAEVERAIVFTRTKRGADRVSKHLLDAGLSAAAIHGDKSQGQRQQALKAFRNDRVRILVATDIAARGIDVDDVSHVINFELPNVPEAYVHRIGRTARAGKSGIAVSLCDPDERGLLRDIERLIGRAIGAEGDAPPAERRDRKPKRASEARSADPLSGDKPPRRRRRARNGKSSAKGQAVPQSRRFAKSGPESAGDGLSRMLGNIGSRSDAGASASTNT
ncbi:ATP-dependent RNA helicase RhlE [Rhodobium orientis]|uniref:DEAD/DEAH box helicase n=1 Tax=Rhodobium orientis TaxID=34017 RepID=A0A327JNC0_9HYPH|nr:DEAD/DEAH box helicase [Rhodobium orientis]MBB4301289.1 ATP-dependent RNA helicase RhlE [Rhodobium orientis]MBK5951121.1 DEAD/DEAH box helicase [Rhodobium orientis]RAI26873.1 DEAD/DEAH box helicase [Rhodobium orientis]